jgi:5-methylcytosine-specific restriction endonuclease McrA
MNIRLSQPKIVTNYANKDRFIPNALYREIKARKKCKLCNKIVKKGKLQIHHKVPVSQGGKSDYMNCIGICKECHDKAHVEEK